MKTLKTIVITTALVGVVTLSGCKSEIDKCVEAGFKAWELKTQEDKNATEFYLRTQCMGKMSKNN